MFSSMIFVAPLLAEDGCSTGVMLSWNSAATTNGAVKETFTSTWGECQKLCRDQGEKCTFWSWTPEEIVAPAPHPENTQALCSYGDDSNPENSFVKVTGAWSGKRDCGVEAGYRSEPAQRMDLSRCNNGIRMSWIPAAGDNEDVKTAYKRTWTHCQQLCKDQGDECTHWSWTPGHTVGSPEDPENTDPSCSYGKHEDPQNSFVTLTHAWSGERDCTTMEVPLYE